MLFERLSVSTETLTYADLHLLAGRISGGDDALGGRHVVRHGLFHEHVLARFERRNGHRGVKNVRRAHRHHVDVLARDQLLVVRISLRAGRGLATFERVCVNIADCRHFIFRYLHVCPDVYLAD